jgi:lipopolysaccharide/colanic/teichoic acid biosynthesis glycosyltransferase
MTLVGPRPHLPEEVAAYTDRERRRLTVKPGITCIWQVSGRADIDFDQWIEMDLRYIDEWSLGLDMGLLARTIPAVLTGRGAY